MSSVVWVYGEDAYRASEFSKSYPRTLGVDTVDRLPDGVANVVLAQALLGVSLLGDKKLVIAKNPQFFLNPSSPESLQLIDDVIGRIPSGHYLLLITTKGGDGRTKGVQALKKVSKVHEFPSFKDWEYGKVREW